MKTIGLVTPTGVYNFGTKLQAYAMQEIFRSRGYDTEIIQRGQRKGILFVMKNFAVKCISVFFPKFKFEWKYKKYIKTQYDYLPVSSLIPPLESRLYSLDSFNTHYKFRLFNGVQDLMKGSQKYIAVVCGSDQIWNPINKNIEFFLLQQINQQVRCFSYAPSIGVNTIPETLSPLYKKAMKNMYAVSVRETSAAQLLQGLSDKKVSVVLDPTLLAGRKVWDEVLKLKAGLTNRSYCLCYLLGTTPEHREMCSKFAKNQNLELYNFTHFKKYNDADEHLEGEHLYDVDPAEFVGLVSKAKFIVTDSFHCSCFAMMYHIPFATLLRYQSSDNESTNSRIFSLLGQFGLEDRICRNMEDVVKILSSNIDYTAVDQILESKRMESNAFVDDALKGL